VFGTFSQWLSAEAFGVFLVFSRIGGAMAFLPGFSEIYVPQRFRLVLAGLLTFVIAPVVLSRLPPLPQTVSGLLVLEGGEIGIGLFIGIIARTSFNALQTAGTLISMQSGLSAAVAFNPTTATEGALTASFLAAIALVVIFVGDMHHMMLRALIESYGLFPPGASFPIGDFADAETRLVASSFSLGVRIAATFIVFGVIFFLGLGILARLMPQMQVFFVSQPAQILLGLFIFGATIVAAVSVFLGSFQDALSLFLGPISP
jgi:flagellar biosynthetic protein FliR